MNLGATSIATDPANTLSVRTRMARTVSILYDIVLLTLEITRFKCDQHKDQGAWDITRLTEVVLHLVQCHVTDWRKIIMSGPLDNFKRGSSKYKVFIRSIA